MTEVRDDQGLLDRLAMSGLATHLFAAAPAIAATGSLDDEAEYLDALGLLAEGPIWRIGAYRYAFRAAPGVGVEAVTAAMHMALPDHPGLDGAEIAPLTPPVPPQSSTPHPGLVLLTAASRTALALPGAQRLVIDAALAEAAAAQVAERIGQVAAAGAARLSDATPPAPGATSDPALGRIEAALEGLRAETATVPSSLRDALDRLGAGQEDAEAARSAGIAALAEDIAGRLDRQTAAQAASAAALATLGEDIAARLDRQEAAQSAAADRLAAVETAVAALAAALDRPAADDTLAERLAALEAEAAAQRAATATGLAALADRVEHLVAEVGTLGAAIAADPAAPRMAEIAAGLADIAARPVVTVDLDREQARMAELAAGLDAVIGRVEAAAARLDTPAEPEGLQGVVERLDALALSLAPPGGAPVDSLRHAIEDGLSRLDSVLARRDAEARALAAAARRMGEACAELYGLHGRYLDALPSAVSEAAVATADAPPGAAPPDPVGADLGAFEADRADDTAVREEMRA